MDKNEQLLLASLFSKKGEVDLFIKLLNERKSDLNRVYSNAMQAYLITSNDESRVDGLLAQGKIEQIDEIISIINRITRTEIK